MIPIINNKFSLKLNELKLIVILSYDLNTKSLNGKFERIEILKARKKVINYEDKYPQVQVIESNQVAYSGQSSNLDKYLNNLRALGLIFIRKIRRQSGKYRSATPKFFWLNPHPLTAIAISRYFSYKVNLFKPGYNEERDLQISFGKSPYWKRIRSKLPSTYDEIQKIDLENLNLRVKILKNNDCQNELFNQLINELTSKSKNRAKTPIRLEAPTERVDVKANFPNIIQMPSSCMFVFNSPKQTR